VTSVENVKESTTNFLTFISVRTQLLGPGRAKVNLLPIEQCWGTTIFTRDQYEKELSQFGASLYVVELPHLFFVGLHRLDLENNTAQIYWATSRFKKANSHTAGTKDGKEEKEDDERKTNLEYYRRAIQTVQGMRPEFLLPLYQTTPDQIVNPPYQFEDFLPPGEGFPKGRVTLLGDAAHLMTPCMLKGTFTVQMRFLQNAPLTHF
jgi:2-polyprenyl-6-methoxyphenol hydroxylase-like FAD-dependent oxidoreductase